MIIEADGGSRGNPGPAGYGAVVLEAATGEVLVERAEGIGVATNNVAEYQGLLAGLRAAAELGAESVEVRMDSKLVVEQMSGRWKIKHPALQSLALEAQKLARQFPRIRYVWIPRERNTRADRLANEAMDAQAGTGPGKGRRAEPQPVRWTGASGTPTRFLLLRHGQTALSVDRRYSGHGEVPLTEVGVGQAKSAADRLSTMDGVGPGTPIVSSPLGRARQTAQFLADAVGGSVVVHPGLIETDFGQWEGLTFAEAAARDPQLHREWLSDTSIPAPGGESFEVVHRRVRRVRDELIAGHGATTVVIVSHVTPIKSLLRMGLDAGPSLLFRLHLDLASLSVVEFYPDGNASVRLVNDTSHLQR
ncbi:bifunctional RNase H/acid phosphatase [Actinophytocola sp.]|uniref:bifunctional RNase H/acid phosphatase n=1 Tax=Actinophytocola sp. TaxID=1872138 RepID=UPI002D7EFB41|nr:bifunctional RNase H/acid phosphatase [Actinophytocola sp.]HET9142543.1 bifunctional RNase H/acid phosphatase [Actinophytocola sp.]